METKKYKIIKNLLIPYFTTIEINADQITSGKKTVKWMDVEGFNYHVDSVNFGMNYIVALTNKNGKDLYLNYVHNILAPKKKKRKFAEIYDLIDVALTANFIEPKSKEYVQQIKDGKTVTLTSCDITDKGVEIRKGMRRKEKVFLPWDDITLVYRKGSGGYDVGSKKNKKDFMYNAMAADESRYMHAVIEKMIQN